MFVRSALQAVTMTVLLALLCGPVFAANRYDPRLRFRTISTPRFNIYFHQGEEALARRLARIAEEVAAKVRPELGVPAGRVHVILVDQTDLSNGWANPTPYNLIEITAAAPSGENSIGNTDDWLRLVFSHEYTHIVHLDKARGWIGGLRRVFGRAPVLYPNLFLPLWQIEGIATYNESALTGEGRVPAGDFRMIVDRAAAARTVRADRSRERRPGRLARRRGAVRIRRLLPSVPRRSVWPRLSRPAVGGDGGAASLLWCPGVSKGVPAIAR